MFFLNEKICVIWQPCVAAVCASAHNQDTWVQGGGEGRAPS